MRTDAGGFHVYAGAGDGVVGGGCVDERREPGAGRGTAAAPGVWGDTIYARSEVLAKRKSRSRPQMGIVTLQTVGYNQNGEMVIEFKRTIMLYKRDHLPAAPNEKRG